MSKKRKRARKKKKLPQSRKLLLPLTESPLNIITEERLKQMDALIEARLKKLRTMTGKRVSRVGGEIKDKPARLTDNKK